MRAWLVGVTLLASCFDERDLSVVQPPQCRLDCGPRPVGAKNRDLDILFVIDNSPAMLDKQTNLANNFPNLINVLSTIDGGLPNLHLGVVTTDLGSKGALDATAGPAIGSGPGACSGTGDAGNLQTNGSVQLTGTFISDIKNADGARTTNYTGTLANVFSSLASVGGDGCGFEQPLEAAKRALDNNPANTGFLRYNANLAIIFVQDEDDCSLAHSTLLDVDTTTLGPLQSFRCNRFGHVCAQGGASPDEMNEVGPKAGCSSNELSAYLTRVQDYVTFFKSLKSDPGMVMVAGIAGPTLPYAVELRTPGGSTTAIPAVAHSCSYMGASMIEVADPAVRLDQLLAAFPNRSTFATVCNQDLSGALTQIAQLLRTVTGTSCIDKPLDQDASTPGVQADCTVSDVVNYGKPNQIETMLPRCNVDGWTAVNKPCWWLREDPLQCPTYEHLELVVERVEPPPPFSTVLMYCWG